MLPSQGPGLYNAGSMAKRFVRISLATKFRLLFGAAVLVIIAAALVVPWYFMEMLAQQNVQRSVEELTQLALQEWYHEHQSDILTRSEPEDGEQDAGPRRLSVPELYAGKLDTDRAQRRMNMILLTPQHRQEGELDAIQEKVATAFGSNSNLQVTVLPDEDETGEDLLRGFRAVRTEQACLRCHDTPTARVRFEPGLLVGMVEVTLPAASESSSLVLWTRIAFLAGGLLAAVLAFVLFVSLTRRLVLRPIRQLTDVADRVAEGDLKVRSTIQTGDELQRLGESFNEMLLAINDQTDKLRNANRALDLRLSELAHANVSLFQANQVKSEFLTNVSHELRTPLNSILGFADLVQDQQDTKIKRWGNNISVAAKNLLNMINDLLDLAKIEAGRAEVQMDQVAISDTCQTLLDLMKPLADKKQITLKGQISPDLPLIFTDGGKVQQILYNLLSNAIKFTPSGGTVTLMAGPGMGGGKRELRISVTDTGPGLPEAEQARIFEKFYQGEKPLTKGAAGTGLGLAISKELSSLLGGRLSVSSAPGHGATFSLHLPLGGGKDQPDPDKAD